jgi:hypothetical protein
LKICQQQTGEIKAAKAAVTGMRENKDQNQVKKRQTESGWK